MSHFVVAVFSRNPEDVERLLAPYDENLGVVPYIEYTRETAIAEGHSFKSMACATDEECYEYMAKEYRERDMIDPEGNLLTTYNPDSKWDWYEVGGRWKNYLRLLDGTRCNDAPVNEVDFGVDPVEYEKAISFWNSYVEGGAESKPGDDFRTFYKPEYYTDQYGTKEAYAKDCASFMPYAFVDAAGRWYDVGAMGWWGFSAATKDSRTAFRNNFDEYVEWAKERDLHITIVDCHI